MRLVGVVAWLCALIAIGARSDPAAACSCAPPGPPRAELERADAVFAGTALDFQTGMRRVGATFMEEPRIFRLRVVAAWKAASAETVIVRTGSGGGDCGYDFMLGDTYVVYAHRVGESDTLATSICTRTEPIERADEDLKELGAPALDRRAGRPWQAFHPRSFCSLHATVPLRLSWAWPQHTTTDHPMLEYEGAGAREFPFAASPLIRDSGDLALRSGSLTDARVCPVCREAALAWLREHGASCDVDHWIAREALTPEPLPPLSDRMTDEEYRTRYPNWNFAFFYDDGRRFEFDSIEGRFDRHIGTIRDTVFALKLSQEELDRVYEKLVSLRLFDFAPPHPPYDAAIAPATNVPCARVQLRFRSGTIVRQLQWNAQRAEAEQRDPDWSKLVAATSLIREILLARPEVRSLPPLPVD
jgi:hypothetical protein